MSVIAFANPKGGTGKTTSAMILALELCKEENVRVAVIDADPNQIIAQWTTARETMGKSIPFHIEASPKETTLVKTIDSLSSTHDFVLVDLEGTASRMVSRAFARADLVVIPLNASPIDARRAAAAVELVTEESDVLGRDIPFVTLFARTNAAIVTKDERAIRDELNKAGIDILRTNIVERAPYRTIFRDHITLDEIWEEAPQASKKQAVKAIDNAHQFASDVIEFLLALEKAEAAA